MTQSTLSAFYDTTLDMVSKMMRESDVGILPVTFNGELKGLITDRDIVVRCNAENKEYRNVIAKDVMTKDPVCISPDHSVIEAARLMSQKKLRRLPVCKNGKLVGMLSLSDISNCKYFFAETAAAFCDICRH